MTDLYGNPREWWDREVKARRLMSIYRRILLKLHLGEWDDLQYKTMKEMHELENKLSECFERRTRSGRAPKL